jgi:hypothetical protein
MNPRRYGLIAALALAFGAAASTASHAAEERGLRIPLSGRQPTMQEAKHAYEAASKPKKVGKQAHPVAFCLGSEAECAPDAPSLIVQTHARYPCGDQYAEEHRAAIFAPIERLPNGAARAARVKADARSGRPFRCEDSHCLMMVESTEQRPTGEKYYGLCRVTKIGETLGPPSECHAVLIEQNDAHMIRVRERSNPMFACMVAHTARGAITFGGRYRISAPWKQEAIVDMVTGALKDTPLTLEVSKAKNHVLGVAGNRVSPYLAPYRELVELRSSAQSLENNTHFLSFDITLLVTRQNPGSFTEYRLPDDSQRQVYLKGVERVLRQTLQRSCPKHKWADSYSFRCDP